MRFGRLFWKLFAGNVVLTATVLVVCAWFITDRVDRFYQQEITSHLRGQADALREAVQDRFDRQHVDELDSLAKRIGTAESKGVRITFIQADGRVLGDSEADPATMEPHGSREEVRQALLAGEGENVRQSRTTSYQMKYFAVRVGPERDPAGVVRVAMAMRTIGQRAEHLRTLLWAIPALGFAAAAVLAMGLARLWSRPIERITRTARSLSRGDLAASVRLGGRDELAVLARALDRMRGNLAAQLDMINHQHRTLQSLVAQLHEGVIVAGPDARIVLMNPAAVTLLQIPGSRDATMPVGRAVEDCIRDHALQRLLLRDGVPPPASPSADVEEARIQIGTGQEERWLLARASDIRLPAAVQKGDIELRPTNVGRLLVLTDITALGKLIQVKADFAANASHELRTPLSAIRASVETLIGMDLAKDTRQAAQFLDVIARHSTRMEAMVTDLLNLSRIESSPAQFEPADIAIRDMFAELHARHSASLEQKNLTWRAEIADELVVVRASPHLMRLVVDNLVDNAVKFTDPSGEIRLFAGVEGDRFVFSVSDTGCGIPEDEQARVFERFYQVERARSGPSRGTGLGLSIVRHAVSAMNGFVELSSRPNEGTTVTLRMPRTPPG